MLLCKGRSLIGNCVTLDYISGQETPEWLRGKTWTNHHHPSVKKDPTKMLEICKSASAVLLLHHGHYVYLEEDIMEQFRQTDVELRKLIV